MSLVFHILAKDLRRVRWGLLGWFVLQLACNVFLTWPDWFIRKEDNLTIQPVIGSLLALLNGIVALIFTARLVAEDAPTRGDGTWQLLPVSWSVLVVEKVLAGLIVGIVPAVLAAIPFLCWLHTGVPLALVGLASLAAVQAVSVLLGLGLSLFMTRNPSSVLAVIIGALGLVWVGIILGVYVEFREVPSLITLYVFLILLFGLLCVLALLYRSARRLPPLFVLLGCFVLAYGYVYWVGRYPTGAFSENSQGRISFARLPMVTLTTGEFTHRMSFSGIGVVRQASLHGLEPGQSFIRSGITGRMMLDGIEEFPLLWVNSDGLGDEARLVVGVPRLDSQGNWHWPRLLAAYQAPKSQFPLGRSRILEALPRYRPSLEPQPLVLPGVDARVIGIIHERDVRADEFFHDARVCVWSMSIRLVRDSARAGKAGEFRAECIMPLFTLGGERRWVTDTKTGRAVEVDRAKSRDRLTVAFLRQGEQSLDYAMPPWRVTEGDSGVGEISPSVIAAGYSNFKYTESVMVQVARGVIDLKLPEVHGVLEPSSPELVERYERNRRSGR